MTEYKASKSAYDEYKTSVSDWEENYGEKPQSKSVRAKLRQKQEAIDNRAEEQPQVKKKDRGAR